VHGSLVAPDLDAVDDFAAAEHAKRSSHLRSCSHTSLPAIRFDAGDSAAGYPR
jgi:hypothetical protein